MSISHSLSWLGAVAPLTGILDPRKAHFYRHIPRRTHYRPMGSPSDVNGHLLPVLAKPKTLLPYETYSGPLYKTRPHQIKVTGRPT